MAAVPEVTVPVRVVLDAGSLPDASRLHLEPGDRLVLSFPGEPDPEYAHDMAERLADWAGVPVVVLADGATVSVVSGDGT